MSKINEHSSNSNQTKFCTGCGSTITDGSKFCSKCGKPTSRKNGTGAGKPIFAVAPQSQSTNTGDSKEKRKILISLIVGAVVLILAFSALSLFTEIFPWSNKNNNDANNAVSRNEDDDGGKNRTNTPSAELELDLDLDNDKSPSGSLTDSQVQSAKDSSADANAEQTLDNSPFSDAKAIAGSGSGAGTGTGTGSGADAGAGAGANVGAGSDTGTAAEAGTGSSLGTPSAEGAGSPAETIHKVDLVINGETSIVEVSPVTQDAKGRPSVTITSSAISGSISMDAGAMFPIVACALLENGDIVDPIPLAGGVVNGAGYGLDGTKELIKAASSNASGNTSGSWTSVGGTGAGYLEYCFETKESIADILVGAYAAYSKSRYDDFLSAYSTDAYFDSLSASHANSSTNSSANSSVDSSVDSSAGSFANNSASSAASSADGLPPSSSNTNTNNTAGLLSDHSTNKGGVSSANNVPTAFIPIEYIGQWAGSVEDVSISLNINPDGTGTYTYLHNLYDNKSFFSETHSFLLDFGEYDFVAQISSDDSYGIYSMMGYHERIGNEETLTLGIGVIPIYGINSSYTIPCRKLSGDFDVSAVNVNEREYKVETRVYSMSVQYTGQWKDDMPNGVGYAKVLAEVPGRFDVGDYVEGLWVNGLLEGPGVYITRDWSFQLKGVFINGLKEGTVQAYQKGSYQYDIEFKDGSPIS